MEFTQYTCPVCNKAFQDGDDVVVCPECGAPHHRECYEAENHCFYEDRHSEDFSFEELRSKEDAQPSDDDTDGNATVVCPVCRHENEKTNFYCSRCGYPLNARDRNNGAQNASQQTQQQPNQQQNAQNIPPFMFGAAGIPNFDPLAGLDSEEEIAEGIKVGEMAKFVGKNTQYFLTVFKRITTYDRSKYNFSAFLLSGIYFLYRKMIGVGILFTMTMIGITVLTAYIQMSPDWMNAYRDLYSSVLSGNYSLLYGDSSLTMKMLYVSLPSFLSGLRYLIMFLSGFFANRWYYRHSVKKIRQIKSQSEGDKNEKLSASGGVNLAPALSFGITLLVIQTVCQFLLFASV